MGYGPRGESENWWSFASELNFPERSNYVNGQLTLGENIADLGGVSSAWRTYKRMDAERALPRIMKDEKITNDRLFYYQIAQNWCDKNGPSRSCYLLQADVHSPHNARVNGPF